jgi:hypothetical protein
MGFQRLSARQRATMPAPFRDLLLSIAATARRTAGVCEAA